MSTPLTPITTIPLSGHEPVALAVTPDGSSVYVLAQDADLKTAVFVVDTTSHDVSDPIQLGRIPAAIVLTPDGSSVYVAEMPAEGQSGSATVIDTATNTVSTAVTLPGRAMGAAVTPDGQRVYVSTEGDGTTGHVMVIDTASNTVVADILDDPFPTRVTMNPNGIHAYVSGIDGGALVDVATNTIPARLDLGDSSLAMAVTLDGETAYLGSDNGFELGVVNLTTHKFVTAVPVKGLQRDVTLTPDGRRVCVMRKSPNAIVLVDVTSNTRIEPPLAWNGTGVAVDVAPDGTRAYVADRGLEALVIVPLPTGVTAYDVTVIGAGIVGSAIARELAGHQLSVAVLEARDDVGDGTSKANTAILHTGFDANPGTLESAMVSSGYRLLSEYAAQTGIPIERTGAILVAWDAEQWDALPSLQAKARANGYDHCEIVSADEVYVQVPHLGPGVLGGLTVPDESIICTWTVNLALATDAANRGVELRTGHRVDRIEMGGETTTLHTAAGRETLSTAEARRFQEMSADLGSLDRRIEEYAADVKRADLGKYEHLGGSGGAMAYAKHWAGQVTEKLTRAMGRDGETRAVVSGSIDIPQFIETEIVPIARPLRLIDLFPNRIALAGNAFEYFQQTVRDNAATAVPDNALKPTSTLTVTPHTDRARVIAHLSEPTPIRLWDDHSELQSWLTNEMVQGVLDGLEEQIIAGDGTGENMLGLLATPGTTAVPFDTDAITTLRSAVTALQVLGEVPDGWALNPVDAQEIDLSRWGTSGGLLLDGYETPSGAAGGNTSNIFGPAARRVVSNSVPAGTAILGDFTKLRVYVRQDANLAIDASGELFTKNQFIARGEGRFGIGVLRPSAFAVVDLRAA